MQFIQAYIIYIYTGIVDVNQSIMIVCVSFAQYIIMHVDYNIIAIYIIINIEIQCKKFHRITCNA